MFRFVRIGIASISVLFACSPTIQMSPEEEKRLELQSITPKNVAIWEGFNELGYEYVANRLVAIEAFEPLVGGVLFIGDSITEQANMRLLFPAIETRNYGVSWDSTDGVLLRLSQITRNSPERIFMKIGTNDLYYGHSPEHISENIGQIIFKLKEEMPKAEFYVMSILPRELMYKDKILKSNDLIQDIAANNNAIFLNVYEHFEDGNGVLIGLYTDDGLHLNDMGNAHLQSVLEACVLNGCDGLE